jgi:hypothetical protein
MSKIAKDLQNRVFSKLTILSRINFDKPKRQAYWNCKCSCGTTKIVASNHLLSGATKSCGCLRKEVNSKRNKNRSIEQKRIDNNLSVANWRAQNKRDRTADGIRHRERIRTDINFKLKCNLRSRLSAAIRRNSKVGSAIFDLGCSILELRQYLESKFQNEMNWNNYGSYWEIDHIVPLASFDLTDKEQFLKACHYTNLQPLSCEDNRRKNRF